MCQRICVRVLRPIMKLLLVDPCSRNSMLSTTQDSIDRKRKTQATASYSHRRVVSQMRCDTCSKPIFPPSSPRHQQRTIMSADPMTIDEHPHNFIHLAYLLILSFLTDSGVFQTFVTATYCVEHQFLNL